MSFHRSRTRRLGVLATSAAAAVGASLLMVSPAHASTADPILTGATSGSSGGCQWSAYVAWTRSTQVFTGTVTVRDTKAFDGCRKRVHVRFQMPDGYVVGSTSVDAPTACATLDPTCPSTVQKNFAVNFAMPQPIPQFVSDINVSVGDR